jgi:flagellar motor switch protein FliG
MADAAADDVVILLLRLMPAPVGDAVLGRLSDEVAARLRARLAAAPATPPPGNEIDTALAHFFDLMRISERAPPKPAAPPAPPPPPTPTDLIRSLPPQTLARALDGEQPGTIALVLSCLEPAAAGQVIQRMPLELRSEVALRLTKLGARNPILVDKLVTAVAEKGRKLRELPQEPSQEELISNLADMLRAVSRVERLPVIKKLEAADPEVAAKITEKLYRIEDLLRIPDRQMQTLLGKLDVKTLAVALKGATPAVAQKVSGNMSSRSREVLSDESELLGSVSASRVKEAQAKVVAAVRKAEEDGEVTPED